MTKHASALTRSTGFTLIELLVVVAIIGVLSSIAYPSYVDHVRRTRRVAAEGCLSGYAQQMERYYTTNMTYVGAALPNLGCADELSPFYTFALVGAPTATAYNLSATPQGQQASRDTKCGTLGVNQLGAQTVSGSSGVAECW